jgi:hypothetical protein
MKTGACGLFYEWLIYAKTHLKTLIPVTLYDKITTGLRRPWRASRKPQRGTRRRSPSLVPREAKSFSTKAEAKAWAAERETEIRRGIKTGVQQGRTVDEAFRRYEKDVSAHKPGYRWEAIRLAAIGQMQIDGVEIRKMMLCDVTSDTLGKL